MATFKFAQSIHTGQPLTFFKSTVPVGRDFTYVTDIVNGVLLALEYSPSRCAEVYNLGFGQTVDLVYLLSTLEKELGTSAKVVSHTHTHTHTRLTGNGCYITMEGRSTVGIIPN